jgi:formylglycine-generating enzyme required for sulfatase activity
LSDRSHLGDGDGTVPQVSATPVQIAMLRGGSWNDNPVYCRSAYRVNNVRDDHYYVIGFRIVCVGTNYY